MSMDNEASNDNFTETNTGTQPAPFNGQDDSGNWYDGLGLDEDTANYLAAKGVKGAGDLVNSYRELERYQGKSIALPGKGAGSDEWGRIYDRLGRPKDPGGYVLKSMGKSMSKEEAAWYRETAHELGLSQKQASGLAKKLAERGRAGVEADETARAEHNSQEFARLDREWGEDKDRNYELARRAARALGIEGGELDALGEAIGSQAGIVRLLARLAPRLGEDSQTGRGTGPGAGGGVDGFVPISKGAAEARIAAIREDPEHPFHTADHPEHQRAVDHMLSLYETVYPDD